MKIIKIPHSRNNSKIFPTISDSRDNSKDSNAMETSNLLPAYRSLEMVLNIIFELFSQWSHILSNIYVLFTDPLYPHADWYSPFFLSIFVLLCSEETDDNNRREDIRHHVIKWGYLKGTIAKLYVAWYIFPKSSSDDTTVCQWLMAGRWFSPSIPVPSTNKSDHHDITVILLKVALSIKKPTNRYQNTCINVWQGYRI
jgi:hypothetical protein